MADKTYQVVVDFSTTGSGDIAEAGRKMDGVRRSVERVSASMVGVNQQLTMMFNKIGAVGRKMSLVGLAGTGALVGLIAAGVNYNAQVEEMTAKLSFFLDTQEDVEAAFEWAKGAVLGTPLMTTEMVQTITLLESAGLAYQDWGVAVADTASALKVPGESLTGTMDRIAIAIGRVGLGDTGQGLQTLRSLGFNMEEVGLKFNKAGSLIDKPKEALEKLNTYMSTKFGGALKDLGDTWGGLWLALRGQAIRTLGEIIQPLFVELKATLQELVDFFRSAEGKKSIKEFGALLTDIFLFVVKAAKIAIGFIKPLFTKIMASEGLKKLLAVVIALGPAFLIVVGLVLQVVGAIGTLATGLAGMAVSGGVLVFLGGLFSFIAVLAAEIAFWVGLIIAAVVKKGKAMIEPFKGVKEEMGFLAYVMKTVLTPVIKVLGAVFMEVFNRITHNITAVIVWISRFVVVVIEGAIKLLGLIDRIYSAMGKESPFAGMLDDYKQIMGMHGDKYGGRKQGLQGGGAAAASWLDGLGDLDLGGIGGKPAGGGGGSGGGSGLGGARGGVTVYQSIEKVILNAQQLDVESFKKILGDVGRAEAEVV